MRHSSTRFGHAYPFGFCRWRSPSHNSVRKAILAVELPWSCRLDRLARHNPLEGAVVHVLHSVSMSRYKATIVSFSTFHCVCCVVLDVGADFIADAGAGLNNSPNDLHCDAEGGGGGGPGGRWHGMQFSVAFNDCTTAPCS